MKFSRPEMHPGDDLKAAAAGLAAGVATGVDMFAMDGTLGALGLLLATGVVTLARTMTLPWGEAS